MNRTLVAATDPFAHARKAAPLPAPLGRRALQPAGLPVTAPDDDPARL